MMNTHLHGGKWSDEEELYAAALIEAFKAGVLPPEDIDEGTSLRKYLAKKLMCSPKRVSKKYEGTNYNGKQVYFKNRGAAGTMLTPQEELALRARIQILEHKFLRTLSENKTPGGLASRSSSSDLDMYAQLQMQSLSESHDQLTSSLYSAAQSPHHASLAAASMPPSLPQTPSLAHLQEQPSQGNLGRRLMGSFSGASAGLLGSSSSSSSLMPRIPQDQELLRMTSRLTAGNQLALPSAGLPGSGLTAGIPLSNSSQLLTQLGSTQTRMEAARLQQLEQSVRLQQLEQSLLSSQAQQPSLEQSVRLQQLEQSLLSSQAQQPSLGSNPLVGSASASLDPLRNASSASRIRAASLLDQPSLIGASVLESYLKDGNLPSTSSRAGAAAAATLPAPATELLGSSAQAQLLQGRPNLALPFPNVAQRPPNLLPASYTNEEAKRTRQGGGPTGHEPEGAPPPKRWKSD